LQAALRAAQDGRSFVLYTALARMSHHTDR
jgi:hypothetical protein